MPSGQSILITGATSGIGRDAAMRLVRAGHLVLAGGRRPGALAELARAAGDRLEPVVLDVTDPASVEAARELVGRRTGGRGLDVLVNNAGYALPGPLEALPEADLRRLFDTNVFGLLAVTRAFVPAMRERGQGRVVNVGSIMGRVAMPLLGAYNASKHAVAAVTDALRMELAPFGVTVVLVEPGAVRTGFAATALAALGPYRDPGSPYAAALAGTDAAWARVYRLAPGPAAAGRAVARAATSAHPRPRYVVPARNRLVVAALTALPTPAADTAKRRIMGLPGRPPPPGPGTGPPAPRAPSRQEPQRHLVSSRRLASMEGHIEIRPLWAADGPACDAIVASLPYHFGQEDGRAEAARKVRTQPGLAAVVDGAVVGFLTVERHFEQAAEISWMAVHADHRRRGLGRALVERLCRDLAAEGRRVLLVLTVSPNDPGEEPPDGYQATRAFYRSVGFTLAMDLPGLWPNDTAVLMVRPLP
jgi:NAD(P)-dependent dehydrogenase (short-subunit alcohol dehydrogenase family)/ribosomal protein S18 acetylase RimI-like enzyme